MGVFLLLSIVFVVDDQSPIPTSYTESVKVDSIIMWIVNLSIMLILIYKLVLYS